MSKSKNKAKTGKNVACPSCKYEVTHKQKSSAVIDFYCPKCRRHKLSEFVEKQQ